MILFVAPNPNKEKNREGFLQRVAAIDELFKDEERVYYDELIDDRESLAKVMVTSDMIYVHSIYQAGKIIDSYPLFANKIVTDLHGIVPEEEKYAGNDQQAQRMGQIEHEVFKYCKKFVAVSHAMAKHFVKKYNLSDNTEWVILPIFNLESIRIDAAEKGKSKTVIYAGGAQRWQNVELMVDAINKTYTKYNFKILTHEPDKFTGLTPEALDRTECRAVESYRVASYYKEASLGFVLRDDIPLNNVACPTKLIEYLSTGVVPVVLSPKVGDFVELGYEYILLKDFITTKVSPQKLISSMHKNLEVVKRLEDLAESGRKHLISIFQKINKQHDTRAKDWAVEAVSRSLELSRLETKIAENEYQIGTQIKMIEDYAELARHRQAELEKILNSKSWLALEALRKPSTLRSHIHKRSRRQEQQ
jgi:hypothetical protein